MQITSRSHRHYISKATSSSTNACNTCGFVGNGAGTFDDSGYRTSSTDGNGHTSYYTYDSQGNMTAKALPAFYTNGYNVWNYTYNSFGEVLTVTDPLGAAGDPNHTTTGTRGPRWMRRGQRPTTGTRRIG
ncbi:MAG: hypothetical protein LAO24_04885 [Acidobacteriia bacterium]|nr:hypothetical protein [Terriglobia bacterium]